jgi:Uma2 family endonuclease
MSVQVARRYFTIEEYHRMGKAGIFSEDDRVELLDGEILKMSPIGSRHAASINRLHTQFTRLLNGRAIVSVQNPVVLNDFSEPQPDIAILKLRDDFYAQALPRAADVLLIVEGGDTSVEYDRGVKLPAYARSGISEVWIVDLLAEKVTVHAELANSVYSAVSSYQRGDSITPRQFPNLSIAVPSILG